MAAPSLIASRRFSPQTRLRLQVLFARAWESLAETYKSQAADFVRRLRPRLPLEEALERYFREAGVPAPMAETVRARALVALAPMIEDTARSEESPAAAWSPLRPDQMFDALKRRAQHVEETNLECRLAASLAGEAIAATHVEMALQTAELLADESTPDEAIMHYVRTFDLSSIDAQLIFRRALARWAERDPLGLEQVEAEIPALAVCASAPRLELPARLRLSLRAIG
jgi:hypothetical protein